MLWLEVGVLGAALVLVASVVVVAVAVVVSLIWFHLGLLGS